MSLKDRLKELRLEHTLLQKDIAKILNLTTSAYGYYEQGKRIPDSETIKILSEFFNVSSDYLLGISDTKKYEQNAQNSNSIAEDKLIEKMKNLDEESKKELEKYMDLLKLKESMDASKDEMSSTSIKQA